MTRKIGLISLLTFAVMSLPEVTSAKGYTYSDVDSFWTNMVGVIEASARPYKLLEAASVTPGPIAPINGAMHDCDEEDPLAQQECREGQKMEPVMVKDGEENQLFYKLYPLDPSHADMVYRRIIWLNMYLNRAFSYHKYRTKIPGKVDEKKLRLRRNSAIIELFLANLRLYYAESSLSAKCLRMKRAKSVLEQIQALGERPELLEPTGHVATVFKALAEQTLLEVETPSSCRLVAIEGRAAQKRDIVNRVSIGINQKVAAKLNGTKAAISGASEPIQDLVTKIQRPKDQGGIPVITDELFKLELDIQNAGNNMNLIYHDKYRLEEILKKYRVDPTDPRSSIGDKFKTKVDEVYNSGPARIIAARMKIMRQFNLTRSLIEPFVSYLIQTSESLCKANATDCITKCQRLNASFDTKRPIFDTLKPLDATGDELPDKARNPIAALRTFTEDLGGCLVGLKQIAARKSSLSAKESLELQFSREMNDFYRHVLSRLD